MGGDFKKSKLDIFKTESQKLEFQTKYPLYFKH
jgi:hypothetical protein